MIERLSEKEKLLGRKSPARGGQMSEEELAAEIEKERQRNFPAKASLILALVADQAISDRDARRCGLRM